jgi:hypothetical protein
MTDFDDTAALAVNLVDLVIAVVHLAGAQGRQVWVLSRYDTCWRWLAELMRIYRQPNPGNWDSVLAEITRDLRSLAGGLSAMRSCHHL